MLLTGGADSWVNGCCHPHYIFQITFFEPGLPNLHVGLVRELSCNDPVELVSIPDYIGV